MADKGIIFSAPMVRALLDGRKTQTRRLLKHADFLPNSAIIDGQRVILRNVHTGTRQDVRLLCTPGDRLYVREACWIAPPGWTDSPVNPMGPQRQEVAYKADDRGYTADAAKDYGLRLRPSIHMPRWASRLTLTVTDVRVQRVQDISEADAVAEGIYAHETELGTLYSFRRAGDPAGRKSVVSRPAGWEKASHAFLHLWDSLHTKPGETWGANPWIVAISFDVRKGNIDA